jgi:hypothetical protein
MRAFPSLALACLITAVLAAPSPAAAQAQGDSAFTLRLGAMSADLDATLSASTDAMDQSVSGSQDFDFGSSKVSPRIDGVWKISDRNRLVFDYFRYDKDSEQSFGQDVSIGGYTLPANSFVKLDTRFQLASLIYDFSVIETENVSLGLELGAEWAKIDAALSGDAGDELGSFRESAQVDGIAPVAGLRFTAIPGENWLINVQGQYLDADWGDFDYSGKIKRANATLEYKFTPNFGVFAGYDWFNIDYNAPYSSGDATDRASLELEFKGPVVGVTFAF